MDECKTTNENKAYTEDFIDGAEPSFDDGTRSLLERTANKFGYKIVYVDYDPHYVALFYNCELTLKEIEDLLWESVVTDYMLNWSTKEEAKEEHKEKAKLVKSVMGKGKDVIWDDGTEG